MKKNGKSERYFHAICEISKGMQGLTISDQKMRFNKTEFRLLSEIITAKSKGERLISATLAKRLNVTRSAVSQIVNKLEEQGVVRRVPDAVDKKIAYVEITGEEMKEYDKEMDGYIASIAKAVEKFGEDKFDRMCALFDEFSDLVQEEKSKQKGDKAKCLN